MSKNHQKWSSSNEKNLDLRSDCEKCFGLCCVALYFSSSDGFPIDKDAGQPCPNLKSDFRCSVYKTLWERGLKGCTAFDCFGAGQKVSQVSFAGHDWVTYPESAKKMFGVFQIMRQLHELIWYLKEALTLHPAHLIHNELGYMLGKTDRITYYSPDSLMELDMAKHREDVDALLKKTSEFVRAEAYMWRNNPSKRRKTFGGKIDFTGADLKRIDLKGENLRGAYLIAADLRGADLNGVDFIGADLRDADLRGADLTKSIFLTQAQINTAKGDINTKIPLSLSRPMHWSDLSKRGFSK